MNKYRFVAFTERGAQLFILIDLPIYVAQVLAHILTKYGGFKCGISEQGTLKDVPQDASYKMLYMGDDDT